jgi:predicted nucleic acid-binding protein
VKRVLVDVNVLLDALLPRPPHSEAATKIWAAAELGKVAGHVPAQGVTALFYLFLRAKGPASACRAVADLLAVFGVAAVDRAVLHRALALGWPDFEDAVCAASAEAAGCDLIVTRDPSGFAGSPVPTVDAATALALFDRGRSPDEVAEPPRTPYAVGRRTKRTRGRGTASSETFNRRISY